MINTKQLLEMLDDEHRQMAEKLLEKIVELQKMILVNSIVYYEFDDNLVSDYKHDQWATVLQKMMRDNPLVELSPLHYVFHDYAEGSRSGFKLITRLTDEDRHKYFGSHIKCSKTVKTRCGKQMLRIAGVIKQSIVDGAGLRFVVFTQGCPHRCKGCHNPQTHDFNGGYLIEQDKILAEFFKNPLLKGITFSGGEPFEQAEALIPIAEAVKTNGDDVTIYSGYTLEELTAKHDRHVDKLLLLCDVLIDGRFVLAERDLTLVFRGSRNQRIIDMNESRKCNKIIIKEV